MDAVFKSGNATRDTIPTHLVVGKDVGPEVAEFYSHVCPAGVYERWGRAARQRAELRRLQGDRRARTPMDAERGGERAEVSSECRGCHKP